MRMCMCVCVCVLCRTGVCSTTPGLGGVSRTHVVSHRHTSLFITHLELPTTWWCVTNTRHEPRTHISFHQTHIFFHHTFITQLSAAHCQQLGRVSRTHIMSHELIFLFITHSSQNCLRHTANNLVVCHEHTSWATNSYFFSSHIHHKTVCGTPATTLVFSHDNTSVVTNSYFFSSHIHHRALFGISQTTWSLVTNTRLSSSQICQRNVCGTPPTTLWCVTNTRHEPRTHVSLHHKSVAGMSVAHRQRHGGVSRTHLCRHRNTFFSSTRLPQNCLRYTANDFGL